MTKSDIDARLAEHAANGDRNAAALLAIRQGKVALRSDRYAEWLRRTGQAPVFPVVPMTSCTDEFVAPILHAAIAKAEVSR